MGWIKTFTGKHFDVYNPQPKDIDIIDIAHALSQICRFTGHTRKFYSVAEHSVRVAWIMEPQNLIWGLLHDASEAYLCDIARPIKYTEGFKRYREIEKALQCQIYLKFGLHIVDKPQEEIKRADNILLMTEGRDLMGGTEDWENVHPGILPEVIVPVDSEKAEKAFLLLFRTFFENQ